MSIRPITWDQFKKVDLDAKGLPAKFESLCRQLFVKEFLSANKMVKLVHSNPGNPGIEADPVWDETNQRWIGYQVKFFGDQVDYRDILNSATKAIKYYANQLDCIYLYCNKQLKKSANNYKDTEKILADNDVSLVPITDDAILDQVREYPYLALYYFGEHSITAQWLEGHNQFMFDELDERFNATFNVDTRAALKLSLFLHDENAVNYINNKRQELRSRMESMTWERSQYKDYFATIENAIQKLSDITAENITDSFAWKDIVSTDVKEFLDHLKVTKDQLEDEEEKYFQDAFRDQTISSADKELARKKYNEIGSELHTINTLLELPNLLSINEDEQQLIRGRVLAVTGEAGMGKSQLLAHEVVYLSEHNRNALLLLAGLYFTNDPIPEQIMKECGLDYNFDELVDMLEAMGEEQGQLVPIMIDALNETGNRSLWEKGLPEIIAKIESCNYVKLVFSFRDGYQDMLLNGSVLCRMKEGDICHIEHEGFRDNTIEAVKKFFDYYGIPFSLYEFLEPEITNPLFLTLYCRTYEGDEVDLPTLYERLISIANKNIHVRMKQSLQQAGYEGNEDLLTPFVDELTEWFVDNEEFWIRQDALLALPYWEIFKITLWPFIRNLEKEHILHSMTKDKEEYWRFAYDQMNDYFRAKAIVSQADSQENVRTKIQRDVLQIEDGKIKKLGNIDYFLNVCACYKERFGEECIDVINCISDKSDLKYVVNQYIRSFQWRKKTTISADHFWNIIHYYSSQIYIEPETLWNMLIGNAVKTDHPLNAIFLHEILMGYDLNHRDWIWTTYINDIFSDESNRITQLIRMYEAGEAIELRSKEQTELLLTLLGWFLTSSNRVLRDYSSKAMIELLKSDFDLCELLLKKFEGVNDPYVMQRLYGVAFGACCKRGDSWGEEMASLAEYTYCTIFGCDMVYPDILLRDYARLIIERFLWERPDYSGIIEKEEVAPPYNSAPIPTISENYIEKEFTGGLKRISWSMSFEGMGGYGDFGRYVFQSALNHFEVDLAIIYNYAMFFIINDLGYKGEWFDSIDERIACFQYDRHRTVKCERIGKKYQWIAMYNILARVADHCKVKSWFSADDEEPIYEGPWDPCVRDFDPTLNCHFMNCKDAPKISQLDEFLFDVRDKDIHMSDPNEKSESSWLEDEGFFFNNVEKMLFLSDDHGVKWITLTKYFDTGKEDREDYHCQVWSWMYAYFVSPEQEETLSRYASDGGNLRNHETTSFHETYIVFNREYPWSPAGKSFAEGEWVDFHIKNYEAETKNEEYEFPLGKVCHASSELMWEGEYDATKEESISWQVPSAQMIDLLHLEQFESDGFYYDVRGKLAAFDTSLSQKHDGIVIRKDLLDKFLKETDMKLVWILQGDKEIYNSNLELSSWCEWSALFTYQGKSIECSIYKKIPH